MKVAVSQDKLTAPDEKELEKARAELVQLQEKLADTKQQSIKLNAEQLVSLAKVPTDKVEQAILDGMAKNAKLRAAELSIMELERRIDDKRAEISQLDSQVSRQKLEKWQDHLDQKAKDLAEGELQALVDALAKLRQAELQAMDDAGATPHVWYAMSFFETCDQQLFRFLRQWEEEQARG